MGNSDSDWFAADTLNTPVPNPVFGRLLAEIDTQGELKLLLRVVWLIHRQPGFPKSLPVDRLHSDRVLVEVFGGDARECAQGIDSALSAAVGRGTLLLADLPDGTQRVFLSDQESRRAIAAGLPDGKERPDSDGDGWDVAAEKAGPVDAFTAYEENIGVATPMIIERIRRALVDHTDEEIVDAIGVAVEANARSWRYVTAVLRHWAEKGRPDGTDGTAGRDPETAESDAFYRRYLERQRERGNR